jgi:hypothetical protein
MIKKMIRIPIQQLVQKTTLEFSKPKPKIHFVDFDKLKIYKPQPFGGRVDIKLKDLSKGGIHETYLRPFEK